MEMIIYEFCFWFDFIVVLQYKVVLGKGAFKKVYPFVLFAMLMLNLYFYRKQIAIKCTIIYAILRPAL